MESTHSSWQNCSFLFKKDKPFSVQERVTMISDRASGTSPLKQQAVGGYQVMDDHVILVTGRQAGNKHQQGYSYCAAP